MKVKAINRSEEACTRERSQDLRKVSAASGLCIAARAQLWVIPEEIELPAECVPSALWACQKDAATAEEKLEA